MRILELADRLRARGLQVVEVAGWQARGREFPARPDICIRHWTAGAPTGHTPSLRVVTEGRPDLRGPLCQIYQSRESGSEDVIFVIASGIANHAGDGEWAGVAGNSKSLGLEIEWSGPDEPFPDSRRATSELAMAALMDCALGTNPDDACEHREYARPAGRKIDTNLDGNQLRARMRQLMRQDRPLTHVIEAGETLNQVAAAHGLSLAKLIDLNSHLVQPGDSLRLQ